MRLLAIDTATEMCSCALLNGEHISSETKITPRGHTDHILPMADKLLNEANIKPTDLDALVFGQGPGSFTGLRIACGVAQGIAFAAELPVIAISNLATIAQTAHRLHGVERALVAWDARMNQVYWGCYQIENGQMQLLGKEQVISPANIDFPDDNDWVAVGNGWQQYADEFKQTPKKVLPDLYPLTQDMLHLALSKWQQGQTQTAAECRPVYLRNQVVQKRK